MILFTAQTSSANIAFLSVANTVTISSPPIVATPDLLRRLTYRCYAPHG